MHTAAKPILANFGAPPSDRSGERGVCGESGDRDSQVNAVLSVLFHRDRVGIAEQFARTLAKLGIKVDASAGVTVGATYTRQVLVSADRRGLKRLRRWLGKTHSGLTFSLRVLPSRRTWTLSCQAPIYESNSVVNRVLATDSASGSAAEIEIFSSTMLREAKANIVFETRMVGNAPNFGTRNLHQYLVVVVKNDVSLAVLDQLAQKFTVKFGGFAEVLPGACYANFTQ